LGFPQSGQQQGGKDGNDRDHDQQLDQGETGPMLGIIR
jgi:hypothetical protein